MSPFNQFLENFVESFENHPLAIETVLANVFSMRIIGNKTHGDLAEIALTEYINQYVDGFSAKHTGKEKFRSKESEEDIRVKNLDTSEETPVSIKTYGSGPLQLSTNKTSSMFKHLTEVVKEREVIDQDEILKILSEACFDDFNDVNVLPLIYNESQMSFKIIIFNIRDAYDKVRFIRFIPPRKFGKKMTYPIYKFYDEKGEYILEVRYGDVRANALQRGMWTHTENASAHFNEILNGEYELNISLINLMSKILAASEDKHKEVLALFPKSKEDSII
ncbi:MAG: hypothetical protein R2681_17540 [Pyrinomonadaceae bacterium]